MLPLLVHYQTCIILNNLRINHHTLPLPRHNKNVHSFIIILYSKYAYLPTLISAIFISICTE